MTDTPRKVYKQARKAAHKAKVPVEVQIITGWERDTQRAYMYVYHIPKHQRSRPFWFYTKPHAKEIEQITALIMSEMSRND